MRQIKYRVKGDNGQEFITSNYEIAIGCGNRITETFLETVDTRTEREKERARLHALKMREHFRTKKR